MEARRKWRIIRILITGLFIMLVWILFSGTLDPAYLLAGCIGAVGVSLLSYDVFIEDYEAGRRAVIPRFFPVILYPFILTYAMYAASFSMLKAVFSARINPRVVHFRSRLHSDLARVLLAHSITFTPGTITLELDEDHYVIHWMFATTRHSGRAGDEIKGNLEESLRRIWS